MDLLKEVESNLKAAIKESVLSIDSSHSWEMPSITLDIPKTKEHGNFATNIAMQLARHLQMAPKMIAEQIVENLNQEKAGVKKAEIAGPGFINFFMEETFLNEVVNIVLKEQDDYGKSDFGRNKRQQVEFVSVNPTGALHLGHARGAAFGDVLCNVLAAAGYDVEREYYINDAGNQIDQLAKSIETRYFQALGKEAEMPKDGYYAEDIVNLGKRLVEEFSDEWVAKEEKERLSFFREYGLKYELGKIEQDLTEFGVIFDKWFSETSLYESGEIDNMLEILQEKGFIYTEDGATWFKSTEFGDDKDRVLIKNDGTYTYLTPDIAYHKNKLERGFEKVINVWGADHHGYIPRMSAAIQALGYPKEALSVKIIQMVNAIENDEIVRMSKRTGKMITLKDLMEDVGVDAVRYFFIMRSNDSKLDFNIDLARTQSNENPVYYVQYAHARICTMLKQAEEKGILVNKETDYHLDLLTTEKEMDVIKQLALFPNIIKEAAIREEPYRMTQYAFDLATVLHSFYNAEKVINDENIQLTKARIALMQAVKITIANVSRIIGVSAPNKM